MSRRRSTRGDTSRYSCISSGRSWGLMIPGTANCCCRLSFAACFSWASLSSRKRSSEFPPLYSYKVRCTIVHTWCLCMVQYGLCMVCVWCSMVCVYMWRKGLDCVGTVMKPWSGVHILFISRRNLPILVRQQGTNNPTDFEHSHNIMRIHTDGDVC